MNAEIHNNTGSGNWVAFLFGAMFNIMANFDLHYVIDYTVQAIVGGIICLLFKMLGDFLTPLIKQWWKKVKAKFKEEDNDRN